MHQADADNDIRFIQKNLRHASIETIVLLRGVSRNPQGR